jgi:hypothetical protein
MYGNSHTHIFYNKTKILNAVLKQTKCQIHTKEICIFTLHDLRHFHKWHYRLVIGERALVLIPKHGLHYQIWSKCDIHLEHYGLLRFDTM